MTHFGFLLAATVQMHCCLHGLFAQAPSVGPQARIVEPVITEETMPNEPGDWDLRMSGSYLWRGAAGSGFLPRAQLFFGIADRWGGEIQVPLAFAKETTKHYGLADISTTLKYLARKPGVRSPGLVLGLETAFPSGNVDKGLGEGVLEAAPFIALVQAFRRVVLQGNLGYSIVHKVRETDAGNQFFYNTALAFPIQRGKAYLLGEINGTHSADRSPVAFSPGVKYNLTPQRYVALALPIGLNSQAPHLGIVLQLQITLGSAESESRKD